MGDFDVKRKPRRLQTHLRGHGRFAEVFSMRDRGERTRELGIKIKGNQFRNLCPSVFVQNSRIFGSFQIMNRSFVSL